MNDYNRGALKEPCLRLPYGGGDEYESVELGDGTGYVKLSEHMRLVQEVIRLDSDNCNLLDDVSDIENSPNNVCESAADTPAFRHEEEGARTHVPTDMV